MKKSKTQIIEALQAGIAQSLTPVIESIFENDEFQDDGKGCTCPSCAGKMSLLKGSNPSDPETDEYECDACKKKYLGKDCGAKKQKDKACKGADCTNKDCKGKDCGMKKQGDSADPVIVTQSDRILWDAVPTTQEEAKQFGFIESFKTTPEGYLKGRACVTTTGVYPVKLPDGTLQRRLRDPSDVLDWESVNSMKAILITMDHPAGLVNSTNAKAVTVGFVGDDIKIDAEHVYAPLTITDATAIQAIKEGKKFLSCGYQFEIEIKSGNRNGSEYDAVQHNIRYNHIALVDRPRAGDDAVLQLDSIPVEQDSTQLKQEPPMKTIQLDGKDFQIDEALALALDAQIAKVQADAVSAKSAVEGERDALKTQLDAVNAQFDSKVAEATKERLAVLSACAKFQVDAKDENSVMDLKRACVAKHMPSIQLDGKDDAYVTAAFDIAYAQVDTADKGAQQMAEGGKVVTQQDSAKDARGRMIKELKNASAPV